MQRVYKRTNEFKADTALSTEGTLIKIRKEENSNSCLTNKR